MIIKLEFIHDCFCNAIKKSIILKKNVFILLALIFIQTFEINLCASMPKKRGFLKKALFFDNNNKKLQSFLLCAMSSFKAYVSDGTSVHTIILPELTMKHLRQQILQVTRTTHADDVLMAIIDKDGRHVETDRSVIRAFDSENVAFTVQFRTKFNTNLYSN
ncbi:hypothetical protein RFI_02591 [Reticulomyxa filosa]|uniref:Uncharacterized protein n=1 Tax=Reticulomyxa filosa TaxID=46433 RepID=X6P8I1_RETFI|nr:hypothetical protein RFI_02591 [Reticulomyxa filosa]|eukprot:ETO34501.1 hypothetical protein RFI_02591 [Reticulomyxa filosa]